MLIYTEIFCKLCQLSKFNFEEKKLKYQNVTFFSLLKRKNLFIDIPRKEKRKVKVKGFFLKKNVLSSNIIKNHINLWYKNKKKTTKAFLKLLGVPSSLHNSYVIEYVPCHNIAHLWYNENSFAVEQQGKLIQLRIKGAFVLCSVFYTWNNFSWILEEGTPLFNIKKYFCFWKHQHKIQRSNWLRKMSTIMTQKWERQIGERHWGDRTKEKRDEEAAWGISQEEKEDGGKLQHNEHGRRKEQTAEHTEKCKTGFKHPENGRGTKNKLVYLSRKTKSMKK